MGVEAFSLAGDGERESDFMQPSPVHKQWRNVMMNETAM